MRRTAYKISDSTNSRVTVTHTIQTSQTTLYIFNVGYSEIFNYSLLSVCCYYNFIDASYIFIGFFGWINFINWLDKFKLYLWSESQGRNKHDNGQRRTRCLILRWPFQFLDFPDTVKNQIVLLGRAVLCHPKDNIPITFSLHNSVWIFFDKHLCGNFSTCHMRISY